MIVTKMPKKCSDIHVTAEEDSPIPTAEETTTSKEVTQLTGHRAAEDDRLVIKEGIQVTSHHSADDDYFKWTV